MNKQQNKKRIVYLILSILLLTSSCINKNLPNINKDLLYKYQWALRNDGTMSIDTSKAFISKPIDVLSKYDTELLYGQSSEDLLNANENFDIDIESAWSVYNRIKNKKETIIAVIDTGIDINHFELSDGIFKNKREIINGIDDDGNGYIDDVTGWNFYDNDNEVFKDGIIDSHGTHVAGQIISKSQNGGIKGICDPRYIKVLPIKILGEGEHGDTENLIKAIKYAEMMDADICNISLGTYEYNEELDVIVKNSDMLFVVACGNGLNNQGISTDEYKTYPASLNYKNVISCANIMFNGLENASSNYGKDTVSLFAPGTYILSTIPNDSFAFQTGSSMATPIVSGVAGMIKSAFPEMNADEIKNTILNCVTKLDTLSNKCASGGYLNAGAIFEGMIDKN